MNIFLRLILAHLLTDFTLQTNFIAKWKRESILGVAAHSLIFFACGILLCRSHLGQVWLNPAGQFQLSGWLVIGVLTMLHFMEDEWRIWTIKNRNSPDSAVFFILDQLIHFVLIFIFTQQFYSIGSERIVAFVILLILTTNFTSIFIFFLEKDAYGSAVLNRRENYYGMAERTLISASFLLPGFWLFSFIGFIPIRIVVQKFWQGSNFSRFSIVLGSSMALFFGLLARHLK